MTVGSPGPEAALRVGTVHREHALETLRNAAADARITFDELEERVPRAVNARTRGDLAAVLDDLLPATELAALLGEHSTPGTGPGWRFEEPLLLRSSGWRMLRVLGEWDVPPFLEAQYGIGSLTLDFTRAQALAPIIDLVLVGSGWGAATLVVPASWGVDTQGLQIDSSSSVTSTVPTRPSAEGARLVVRGRVSGTVTVRTPTRGDERRAERLLTRDRDAGSAAVRAALEAGR